MILRKVPNNKKLAGAKSTDAGTGHYLTLAIREEYISSILLGEGAVANMNVNPCYFPEVNNLQANNPQVNNQLYPQTAIFQPLGQSRLNWGRKQYFSNAWGGSGVPNYPNNNYPVFNPLNWSLGANYPLLHFPQASYLSSGVAWAQPLPLYYMAGSIPGYYGPNGIMTINSGFSSRGLELILIVILILAALDIIFVRPFKQQS